MPNVWRTSEIKGTDVYNDRNEKIGNVDDVLVDSHGNVKAVVIGVGGFLGVGERNVAVPFNELHWQVNTTRSANGQQVAQDMSHPSRATLPGVTKEQLQQAPEFKYAR
jgi:sporulation protein YlmC with PRC-barrel domain